MEIIINNFYCAQAFYEALLGSKNEKLENTRSSFENFAHLYYLLTPLTITSTNTNHVKQA